MALSACVGTNPSPSGPPASITATEPATPLPIARIHPPEQDVAYVRQHFARYDGTATGWSWLEDVAVLQEFHWRAVAANAPGYVAAYRDEPRLMIDVKPPYDRAALLAMLAPELRDRVTIREIRHNRAEAEALKSAVIAASENAGVSEMIAGFSQQNDRMEVILTDEDEADRLRAALTPEQVAATHITIAPAPMIVY